MKNVNLYEVGDIGYYYSDNKIIKFKVEGVRFDQDINGSTYKVAIKTKNFDLAHATFLPCISRELYGTNLEAVACSFNDAVIKAIIDNPKGGWDNIIQPDSMGGEF